MQERIRAERDRELISRASHGDALKMADRRPSSSRVAAERGEVAFTEKQDPRPTHRGHVQPAGTMPGGRRRERIGDIAGRGRVAIRPGASEACRTTSSGPRMAFTASRIRSGVRVVVVVNDVTWPRA